MRIVMFACLMQVQYNLEGSNTDGSFTVDDFWVPRKFFR